MVCAGTTPLLDGNEMLTSKNKHPPQMCYHAEFGRSVLKGVGINTGKPPKLGSPGTPLS